MVANRRARCRWRSVTAAMVANVRVALVAAAAAPTTFDPDVTAALTLPTTLLPDITGALALVITIAPLPAVPVANPAALDPDVTRTRIDNDNARRRRFLLHLHVGNGGANATAGTHDAPGTCGRSEADDREATEEILQSHIRSSLQRIHRANAGPDRCPKVTPDSVEA